MLDFTDIEKAIIHDLKPVCIYNYLILNQFNLLPNEVNLLIVYDQLQVSDAMILLRKDIYHLRIDEIRSSIISARSYSIDILSPEYGLTNCNLTDQECVRLYKMDDQIGSILRSRINDAMSKKYEHFSEMLNLIPFNFRYYIKQMETNKKYSKLLKMNDGII